MNYEHDPTSRSSSNDELSSLWFLIYSTVFLVCVLLSFRHVKRIRNASPPKRRKMTNSPPVLEPTRRGNGKQRQSEEFVSVARDPGPDPDSQSPNQAQQLPSSASDVLEPLSRIAPVPASGRAAAEAAAGIPEGEYDAKEFEGDFGSDSALNLNQSNRSESESERDPADLHFPAKNPRADLSDSRLEQHTTHSHSIPVIANASNPAASLGWYGYPGAGAATVPLSSDPEAGSIQKRNETVQLCHDVDAEGIRSWKRLIVEYS